MAVTTKKTFSATSNATTTVFSPVGIQLNNQDDLDVYVTLSGGTRVLQLRQSTGSTATSNHPQVNDTTGLYFPAVSAGTTLYNYQLSTDNNTITFNSALPQGAVVSCERRTRDADSSYTTFASGSTIRATDLNNSSTESNFTAQDGRNKAFDLEGKLFNGPADGSIKTKLDGIEANATQDQTASEIRALVESASDSNVFTDADHSKLNAIEAGATTDQTASEIRALVESASDSNVFTDADHSKLDGIEASATADQTAAEIRTLVESATDSNVFTDADHSKLDGIATGADVTSTNSINALTDVNTAGVSDGKILKYDSSVSKFVIADDGGGGGSGGSSTFTGLSDTPANFGSSAGKVLKVNSGETALEFSDADVVADTTPQLGGNLDVQASEITTSTTNGNIKLAPNGTGKVEIKGNGSNDAQIILNCSDNSHGQTIKAPPHSAGVSNTFTLPTTNVTNLGAGTHFLKTTSAGQISISSIVPYENGGHINMASGKHITFGSNNGIIFDSDNTNTHNIYIKAPTTLTKDSDFILPEDGSSGQFLTTDGSGVLSFADPNKILQGNSSVEITGTGNNAGVFEVKLQDNGANTNAAQTSLKQYNNSTYNYTILNEGNVTKNSVFELNHHWGTNAFSEIQFRQTGASTGTNKIRSNGYDRMEFHTDGTGAAKFNLGPSLASLAYDFIPSTDNSKDLGSSSYRWAEVHATTFHGSGANLTDIESTVANGCIYENSTEITADFSTSTTKNSMSAGPITIANNVTLTIPNNSVYTIV